VGKPDAEAVRAFVADSRRAVLATTDEAGRPRLVPIAFTVDRRSGAGSLTLYTPIDEKPKETADPLALARVRDLRARPDAMVLVDRWSEAWSELGWVRLACRGSIVEPASDGAGDREHAGAIHDLRAKYPQYRSHRLETRPLIRLDCTVANAWGSVEEEA
jgi:PPOX class probable F420-dependent enzyme